MKDNLRPIFIFSLPRSGSTLLQRILACHPDIATAAEPWVLIPLVSGLRKEGIKSDYGHYIAQPANEKFFSNLPGGIDEFYKDVRKAALSFYKRAAGENAKYFLDKTPRYHLILDEIFKIFPDGKFIFLWRNPIAIAASIVSTFGRGKWNLYKYNVDIYKGLLNLLTALEKYKEKSISIQYEEILRKQENAWEKIFTYLDLDTPSVVHKKFNKIRLKGMGDQTGIKEYQAISPNPIDKWKSEMATPLRKYWCKCYLKWIGENHLSILGYSYKDLVSSVNNLDTRHLTSNNDIFLITYGYFYNLFELNLLWNNLKKVIRGNKLYNHI